mgnify:CR=1 FL=1
MIGKIITVLFILILILAIAFLMKDSGFWEKLKKSVREKEEKKKEKDHKKGKTVLYMGPTIRVIYKDNGEKATYEMKSPVFTIGRDSRADLCIDREYVSRNQAKIRRVNEGGEIYYTLTNYGKTNSTKYYNPEKDKYEWMDKEDEVELGGTDIFCFGDVQLLIMTPQMDQKMGPKTRGMIHPEEKEKAETWEKAEKKQEYTNRKHTERIYTEDDFDI